MWARAGYSAKVICAGVGAACAALPNSVQRVAAEPPINPRDPAHVLTIWHSDPDYLINGQPKPLPLRGPGPSIEELVRLVDPGLNLMSVVKQLREASALKKVGKYHLPLDPIVSHRGSPQQPAHQLETLDGLLHNLEHNSAPKSLWPSWYDFTTDCPNFPVSALEAFRRYLVEQADDFLRDIDDYMRREEIARAPGEPTTRLGVTVFQHQDRSEEHSAQFREMMRKLRRKLMRPPRKRGSRIRSP